MRHSAGILPFRRTPAGDLELFIAHMGGPLWARKDARAWSVVKGEYDPATESPEAAARREFAEETGAAVPTGELIALGEVRQKAKVVVAYAIEAPDLDPEQVTSNTFEIEWPPRSGRRQAFPEIDRAAWVPAEDARGKLVAAQADLVDRLARLSDPA